MGYANLYCVACKSFHDAGEWYYRPDQDGEWEYLCDSMFNDLSVFEEVQWLPIDEPGT